MNNKHEKVIPDVPADVIAATDEALNAASEDAYHSPVRIYGQALIQVMGQDEPAEPIPSVILGDGSTCVSTQHFSQESLHGIAFSTHKIPDVKIGDDLLPHHQPSSGDELSPTEAFKERGIYFMILSDRSESLNVVIRALEHSRDILRAHEEANDPERSTGG